LSEGVAFPTQFWTISRSTAAFRESKKTPFPAVEPNRPNFADADIANGTRHQRKRPQRFRRGLFEGMKPSNLTKHQLW
jgi:hypothetical protein